MFCTSRSISHDSEELKMEGLQGDDSGLHQRVLVLRDVALGISKSSKVNSELAPASYDSAVDSLLALHEECSQATGLSKNRNVANFLGKYRGAVKALKTLRVTADDFEVASIVGRGHFGEVQVVHEKSTREVYAMKVMKKAHILQQPDSACFSEERDIMAWATSPWLTCLHYAFQDSTSLYLVMDYHPGGDLLTVMERRDEGMTEKEAKFYLSEIATGLNDLHQLGFVHRDVKPENVLISRSGHIKLVDFGSAARLGEDGKVVESRLPVGTPEYIAPEVLTSLDKSADYGVCCDWWSLGIIAYELLYVSTPFEGETTSVTYGNVMNYKSSLCFSDDVTTSEDVQSLIKNLLTGPVERLSFSQLKEHSFFSSVDWKHLFAALPPYIPSVSSPDDTSNFDVFEPKKDDLDIKARNQREFSGKTLPFVGFTFTRFNHAQLEFTDSSEPHPSKTVSDIDGSTGKDSDRQWSLERAQNELKELKERNRYLEKECVVYQSQLEEYHQMFEKEKTDRRQSDSKALKLLEEVKTHNDTIRELRKEEQSVKEAELKCVVTQLEQDRLVASNKARRLQTDLASALKDKELAVKVALELKSKLKTYKESSKKDIAALQSRLQKVSTESLSQSSDVHEKFTEAFERYSAVSKKLKAKEDKERESKLKIHKLESVVASQKEEVKRLNIKLESAQSDYSEQLRDLEKTVEALKTEKRVALQEADDTKCKNKELLAQLTEVDVKTQNEEKMKKEIERLKKKVQSTQERVSALNLEKRQCGTELQSNLDIIQRQKETMVKLTLTEQDLRQKLNKRSEGEATQHSANTELQEQADKIARLEEEKHKITTELCSLSSQLEAKTALVEDLQKQLTDKKAEHEKATSSLVEEVRTLQGKLSETGDVAIKQGEKLREVRASKRSIDLENSELKLSLRKMESERNRLQKQCETKSKEADGLKQLREKISQLENELITVQEANKVVAQELDGLKTEKENLVSDKRKVEIELKTAQDKLAAEELSSALLQRKLKMLEDEIAENKTAVDDLTAAETHWKNLKATLVSDLETAESRLDESIASTDKEKNARISADKKYDEAVSKLERVLTSHSEELENLRQQLDSQRELNSKCSGKVLDLEKELKLKELSLKELQRDLETEKACYSKVYEDLYSLRLDHGMLKAAYSKLHKESEEQQKELNQTTAVRDRVMGEQKTATQAYQVQETRMQSTIEQQGKLIDFLQGVGMSPPTRGLSRIAKGLKIGRKARDPAKEIAEWNKLKRLVGKPHKGGNVPQVSTSLSSHEVSESSLSSTSSVYLQSESPARKSSRKNELPQSAAKPDTIKVEKSALFKFPVMSVSTGKKKRTRQDSKALDQSPTSPELSLTPILTKRSSTRTGNRSAKKLSADLVKENVSDNISTKRRKAEPSKSDDSEISVPPAKISGAQHNIPHKFRLHKSGIHKAYKCNACKEQIKTLQRYAKCTYCNLVCHHTCVDNFPNNCGLPAELATHTLPIASSKKKHTHESSPAEHSVKKRKISSPNSQEMSVDASVILSANESLTSQEADIFSSTPAVPRTGIIMIERITLLRGDLNTAGWLVLDHNSLSFYDRDPRGLTRKPVHYFDFTSSDCILQTLSSVSKQEHPFIRSPNQLSQAFGIRKYSKNNLDHQQVLFLAPSLQSKIDWVENIGNVLSNISSVAGSLVYGDAEQSTENVKMETPVSKRRSLKSVSIVPIRSLGKDHESELDLSIRSSMLGDSDSNTSFI